MTVAPTVQRLLSATVRPGAGFGSGLRCGGWASGRRGMAAAAAAAAAADDAQSEGRKTTRPRQPPQPLPFPTVASCPAPTCACEPMPAMPEDLPIDRTSPLSGLITRYDEQVLVCTGRADWPSRIEEASSGDNLAADLKELFGRGGKYSDPYHHVSVLNTSFPPSPSPRPDLQSSSVYLLPSFRYVPLLPRVSFDSVDALARGYLLPERLHAAHDGRLSPAHRDLLTQQPAYRRLLWGVQERVDDVLVLVCGHGGRDARCGVLGPVLQAALEAQLGRVGVDVRRGPVVVDAAEAEAADEAVDKVERLLQQGTDAPLPPLPTQSTSSRRPPPMSARVGLVSHIGGHKFAGNVIFNLPPGLRTLDQREPHPLAGYGIWYGRVEPEHVEGLVHETIVKGVVVEEHFRGAINRQGEAIRM